MPVERIDPILNVSDVPSSMEWFSGYGWRTAFTWNDGGDMHCARENDHGRANFGSICAGDATLFLCEGGQGARGDDGVWMIWWVESRSQVDRLHALALERGDTIGGSPIDEPWGVREFRLIHPDGHTFRVSCGL